MFCEYVSTTGNRPTHRIGSVYDEDETETISVLTVECRYNYFFLWRAIDFSMTLLEKCSSLDRGYVR